MNGYEFTPGRTGQKPDSRRVCLYSTAVRCITQRGRITVKGTILQGQVLEQGTNGVRFETIHGSGELLIPYIDIELLRVGGNVQTA